MPRKVSGVWRWFNETANEKGDIVPCTFSCKLCPIVLMTNRNSTSNLKRHLDAVHKTQIPDLYELSDADITICEESSQIKIARIESPTDATETEFVYTTETVDAKPAVDNSRRTSEVWRWFDEVRDENGIRNEDLWSCKLCSAVLSSRKSTSNLKRHLKAAHKEEYEAHFEAMDTLVEFEEADNYTHEEIVPASSHSMDMVVDETEVDSSPPPLTDQLNRALLRLVCMHDLPLDCITGKEFKDLVAELNPTTKLLTRKEFCRYLETVYQEVREKVMAELATAQNVALLFDSGNSNADKFFISLTCSYITKNGDLKTMALECRSCDAPLKFSEMGPLLVEMVDEWKLTGKAVAVTTSSTVQMKLAVRSLHKIHIPCIGQVLNGMIDAGLKGIETVHEKVKEIVNFYRGLTVNRLADYQEQHGLPAVDLVGEETGNWKSTLQMFKSALASYKGINSYTRDCFSKAVKIITEHDVTVLQKSIDLLSYFEEISRWLTVEETSPLVSMIILFVGEIYSKIEKMEEDDGLPREVNDMCSIINSELHDHFGDVEDNETFGFATLLDPRFKMIAFRDTRNALKIKQRLIEVSSSAPLVEDSTGADVDGLSTGGSIWAKRFSAKLRQKKMESQSENPKARTVEEMNSYMSEPLLSVQGDPIAWWKSRKTAFPRLYQQMRRHLCVPATIALADRISHKPDQPNYGSRGSRKVSKLKFLKCHGDLL